jgi:hypothetical protein
VGRGDRGGDERGGRADGDLEVAEAADQQHDAEHERLDRQHAAVRQRAMAGAVHARVEVALGVLVQRQGAAGRERGVPSSVCSSRRSDGVPSVPEVVATTGRDQHHHHDARLQERHVVGCPLAHARTRPVHGGRGDLCDRVAHPVSASRWRHLRPEPSRAWGR